MLRCWSRAQLLTFRVRACAVDSPGMPTPPLGGFVVCCVSCGLTHLWFCCVSQARTLTCSTLALAAAARRPVPGSGPARSARSAGLLPLCLTSALQSRAHAPCSGRCSTRLRARCAWSVRESGRRTLLPTRRQRRVIRCSHLCCDRFRRTPVWSQGKVAQNEESKDSKPWNCSVCTFENRAGMRTCATCHAVRADLAPLLKRELSSE